MALSAGLWGEKPDISTIGQRGQGVDQRVNEVTVFLPPPHQDYIDDILIVLVDKLNAVDRRDRLAQLLIAIRVIAEFLHYLARFNAEPLGLAAFILRLARGRAH